jgi:hypothetical protein
MVLLAIYTYNTSSLEGFSQDQSYKTKTAPKSRFIFAGYNPLYDLIASQALIKHLDTRGLAAGLSTTNTNINTNTNTKKAGKDTTRLQFRDIPRLHLYWLNNQPHTIHVFMTSMRKPQPIIDLVEGSISAATNAALDQQSSDNNMELPSTMEKEAKELGDRLRKAPPATINMRPSKKQREQMISYIKLFMDREIMPIGDIRLTEADSSYLELDSIFASASNPEDDMVIPEIYIRDLSRRTYVDLLRQTEAMRVNIITPDTITEAKELAQKAAEQDLERTIYRVLFENPDSPPISKNRVINFKLRTITDIVTGSLIALVYFRLADDDTEVTRQQLFNHLVSLDIAKEVSAPDNPHFPDYLITMPIHHYQQVQVIIKATERGWEASLG